MEQSSDICLWTVDDVVNHFARLKAADGELSMLKAQSIDGKLLHALNDTDLAQLIPSVAVRARHEDMLNPNRKVSSSKRFSLSAPKEFDKANEFLMLLEFGFESCERHFFQFVEPKCLPEFPFFAEFYDTREQYESRCQSVGIPAALYKTSGGMYWTGTETLYLYNQPSEVFTRHLLLHELTHQFHGLYCLGNCKCFYSPEWYLEGIAEEFGYHKCDLSRKLLMSHARDVVCLEQDLVNIRERAVKKEWSFCETIEGKIRCDRPKAWACVHFLLHGADYEVRQKFKLEIEPQLLKGNVDGIVAKLFGSQKRELIDEVVRQWIMANVVQTWKIVWVNFDERFNPNDGLFTLVSKAGATYSLIVSRQPAVALSADFSLLSKDGRGGIIVDYKSDQDFYLLSRILARGRLHFQHFLNGAFHDKYYFDCTPKDLAVFVSKDGTLHVKSGSVEYQCNHKITNPAPMGFFAFQGHVLFENVKLTTK